MKRFASVSLALVSACSAIGVLDAARPRYGGTLRVEAAETIRRVDPSAAPADNAERWLRDRVLPLIFEGLTRVDSQNGVQPLLAVSWKADDDFKRWRIRLASGIAFHDGSLLQAGQVAATLQAAESRWSVGADRDTVLIDLPQPIPDLPWRLAEPPYAMAVRTAGGQLVGTGPFQLERIEESQLVLRSYETYRAGRPFVDRVHLEMGRSATMQVTDLENGRADLVEALPTDGRRLAQRGLHLLETKPLQLMALVFEPHRTSAAFDAFRATVAGAMDRSRLASVLLQQHADAAVGLLPPWLSGYHMRGPAMTSGRGAAAARPDRQPLVLRFDGADPLAHAVAERIAVDLGEAGLAVTLQSPTGLAPRPDARLIRVRLSATSPDRALTELVAAFGPAAAGGAAHAEMPPGAPIGLVYQYESQLLARSVIVPIVHLPELYAASPDLATWQSHGVLASGAWAFDDVWLRTARP